MRQAFTLPLFLFLCLFFPLSSFSTVISSAAAAMKVGEWRKLYTINMSAVLNEPLNDPVTQAASGGILGYADKGVWDPGSSQFLFIGGDHFHGTGYARFVAYSETTNTWRIMPRPSWIGPITGSAMHGYDHNALNEKDGIFYHRPFANSTIHRYDIKQGTWSTLPSNNNFSSGAFGLVHFPEAGGLIAADVQGQGVYLYNETTQQWKTLSTSIVNNGGGLHNSASYDPVHHLVIFGGGNGNRALYKIEANQTVTRLKDAPVDFSSSGSAGLLTVDPASGDFLVFTDDGRFFVYTVMNDTWTLQPGTSFFNPILQDNTRFIWEVVGAPLPKYGVATFIKVNYNFSTLYLYKHAASPVSVEKIPAPSSAMLSGFPAGSSADLFDLRGKRVARIHGMSGGDLTWKLREHPPGVYFLKALDGGRKFVKKILIQ